jgi:hypothetical protein
MLSRVRPCIGSKKALASSTHPMERPPHDAIDGVSHLLIGDRRQPIGCTIELIELVGELVDDDIPTTVWTSEIRHHLRP